MNNFSGELPPLFGDLTELIQLNVSRNNLGGEIPANLGNCKRLVALDLSRNNFSSKIPEEVVSLSSLSIILDLSQNKLTGVLPSEVGNLLTLGRLDVSGNELSGDIPSTIGACETLEVLNMSSNNFQGKIPESFKSLKAIQVLELSRNNLSGQIPDFLSRFALLKHLNLSYNNFEGLVTIDGVFGNTDSTSIQGNNRICGGNPVFHLRRCVSRASKTRRQTRKLKLVISITCSLLAVTIVSSVILYLRFRQKKIKEPVSEYLPGKLLELSYQALYNATNGFSSANMIGSGSFGSVFKGTLEKETTCIAVKVFNLVRHGAFKSFIVECEALRNIKHRNLVRVLTACSSIDYQGNDFKALVYEFMVNGSLDDWLHKKAEKALSMLQRLNIAIDVANALDYLHNHSETPIIHCELKPSNILLDEEMMARLGDFGIAKFNDTINHSSSIGVRGTVGYAPPVLYLEYGMGNEVLTKGDVYSYGVLLLEMFTGKQPTDDIFSESLSFRQYVKAALPERVVEILDPDLVKESIENRDINKSSGTKDAVVFILDIGVACSDELPETRMRISDVLAQLILIRNKFLRSYE